MGNARMPEPATALDHESTIVTVVELSARSWLVGAQVAGVPRQCRQKLAPSAEGLLDHLDHLRQRAGKAGKRVSRARLFSRLHDACASHWGSSAHECGHPESIDERPR